MDIIIIKKEIERVMLEVANQNEKPDVIMVYIDTSYDDESNIVPFLNVFGNKTLDNEDFDEAIKTASKQQDEGFMWDVLDEFYSSTFDINLSVFYPQWPNNFEDSDKKVVTFIKNLLSKEMQRFEHIRKLYFFHVDSFKFTKIIDK
ncbi:hypothetical protein [Flavivirga sp. 57AJ16]|uniref:hypothetical protein n=1 Tax=Flavivirga sp. 57AJ16 TaxID=3025307 RepID=UPI002365DF5F|nr:hypothetical protein [Flavivirga sp. 57AJ16]MDD7885112.1 hypothetical protein [Flavivirga sp. 57AJ16]